MPQTNAEGVAHDIRNHHHEHAHGHRHGHEHRHGPVDFGTAFAVATAINIVLVAVQVYYGIVANSVALLADAGHNFGDVVGLVMAWIAQTVARRDATDRFTYGFGSASILAAFMNAVLLIVATAAIAWEAVVRLQSPAPVVGSTVMVVAAIGLVVNGLTAWMFARGRSGEMNVRAVFLHMVSDAAISLGVIAAGGAVLMTGWLWLDPLASLVIAAVIAAGTWGILRESLGLVLQAAPATIETGQVRAYLEGLPGVAQLDTVHIWALSTTETALSCHLVMKSAYPGTVFIDAIARDLRERFDIAHATVQVEADAAALRH